MKQEVRIQISFQSFMMRPCCTEAMGVPGQSVSLPLQGLMWTLNSTLRAFGITSVKAPWERSSSPVRWRHIERL